MEEWTPATIAARLDGDPRGLEPLVRALTPAVQAEVARAMVRGGAARGRDGRQEVLDATQEVLCALFADGGKTLRSWDPTKGRKLVSFVRLVAKRKVISMLRSQSKTPWADDPTEHDTLEFLGAREEDEGGHEHRDTMNQLWARLKPHLGERGLVLFQLLFVEQEDVEVVMTRTEMTRDAIYAWRSRLRKQARAIGEELGVR